MKEKQDNVSTEKLGPSKVSLKFSFIFQEPEAKTIMYLNCNLMHL